MTPEEWNKFVIEQGGSFLQTWEWATFQESLGNKIRRMRFEDAGGVFAVANAILLGLPAGQKCLSVHHGPVEKKSLSDEQYAIIVQALRNAADESGACVVRVDALNEKLSGVLRQHHFTARRSTQPNVTLIVDLSSSEDSLLEAMHQKTRYNIHVAEKKSVTVRRCDRVSKKFSDDIAIFLELLSETTTRDKFSGHEPEYYSRMIEGVHSNNISTELYLAEHEGVALAGGIFIDFNRRRTYLHGASSNKNRQVMSPYALHWQAMRDAKKDGYTEYDFWGIAPSDDEEHPWAGITRFKKGFGGRVITYAGGWELPMPGFWGTVYRILQRK